ncbi:hypothetical protein GCM10011487_65560 [Steroidobacter agaridevorans]|uniref:Uncharacterized protein n=1 Tax=Steroidobacter agaridevorans TaxID=2695856 RepID=A0A829YQ17_9GAMM|nr:hypothetical protein [Steroidobacter agaridevorans]GFE84556.1 hypothetical protein GCM10011487_65560 [Steroidobacter agaridevorans]GFE90955.1 hypothetical protein GCM10011488_59090 [Steroidobacter agaridevorans]
MTQDRDVLILDWLDLFDNEREYRLERRLVGDTEWREVGTEAAGDGERMLWKPSIHVSATYRLVAVLNDHSVPLHAGPNETEFEIDLGASPSTISVDQAEPVSGSVQVSVQNAGPALSVTYYLDNAQVAQSTSGGTFTATLPTERLPDGQRALTALVQKTEGLGKFVYRPLQVANPAPALLLNVTASSFDASAPVWMSAKTTSGPGIVQVAFFANDAPLAVVTTPSVAHEYSFAVDRWALPSGPTVFRAVATDYNGATVSMEQRFTIDHFPSKQITGLFDGMIATDGRLDVQATFGDDAPGATLTILVGEQSIVQTQTSPLTASYSLADLAPGEYPMVVRVRDASGNANLSKFRLIVPSTGLNYELLTMEAKELLAADAGSLLYRNLWDAIVLRDAAGAERRLPGPSPAMLDYWLIEDRVVARGDDRRMFVLNSDGSRIDLSAPDDLRASYHALVRGPWVIWANASAFRLYNVRTGATSTVQFGSSLLALRGYDLDTTPGHERLLFSADLNGVAGIYSHDLTSGTTQPLVSTSATNPRTDGTRMSWLSGSGYATSLLVAPIDNPTANTVLHTSVAAAHLEDGLLCWQDQDSKLYVNDGSTSTTTLLTGYEQWNAETLRDGHIMFREDNKMRVWTVAGGERVWLDTLARDAIQADGVAYFLTGSHGTLYRVSLP